MDIEKIYKAVEANEMNSPLITICSELKKQGYNIKIEGVELESLDNESKLFEDLECATNKIEIELYKDSEEIHKFKIVFTGYHQFDIQNFS